MNVEREFAEQYSPAQRFRLVITYLLIGGAVVLVAKTWFFPWLRHFSATAQCSEFVAVNGTVVLLYAAFIGLPLSAAIVVACVFFWQGHKILRDGQYPPIGQKVLRPTRIRKG